MKSVMVGDIEIIALTDVEGPFFGLGQIFPGVAPDQWEPYRKLYPWAFADPRTLYGRVGAYLLRSPGHVLLVDAGIGPGMRGRLPEDLERSDVRPEDVDAVFLTHLHGDHVGWMLTRAGEPRFPNAHHMTQAAEWEATEPYLRRAMSVIDDGGDLYLLEGEERVADGLTAVPTPGHSPGHASLLVESRGQQALIVGDAVAHPAQVTEPSWNTAFDSDKAQAAFTRQMLLDWAEADDLLLAAGHVPGSGFGRVTRGPDGRRYWQTSEETSAGPRGPGHGTRRSAV